MSSRPHPTPDRAAARLIGALFLISTVAYMLGSGLVATLVATPEASLGIAAADAGRLVGGVLLQLVNCAAVVAIGALIYPTVRRHSEAAALGYAGARVLESAFLAAGGVATLLLPGMAEAARAAGAGGEPAALMVGALLTDASGTAYQVAMLALGLGSLPLCAVLYRARLIPRPLAALGLLGYATLAVGSALELYGLDLRLMHNLPGGIFELLLPLWLIVKGFAAPTAAPRTRAEGRDAAGRAGAVEA